MSIDHKAVVDAYESGESMVSIARMFGTYTTSISRILSQEHITTRNNTREKGKYYVQDGDKLLEWAKSQGRLVTQAELAAVIGKKRLSPSYFLKYPELGQYVKNEVQTEFQIYYDKLYDWLQKNNIPYKPGDRTKLRLSIDALLLGEYSNLMIHIAEKPYYTSKKKHEESMMLRANRAKELGMTIIFLSKEHFDDLDEIKGLLDSLRR